MAASPGLQHLRLYVYTLSVAAAALHETLARLTALSTLDIISHCDTEVDDVGTGAALGTPFAESLPASLVTLHLPSHRDDDGEFAAALCARLGRATGLTALHLHWAEMGRASPRLPGAAYAAGLRQVASLRRLQLEACVLSGFEDLCSGLATLPHLQFLHLNGMMIQVCYLPSWAHGDGSIQSTLICYACI